MHGLQNPETQRPLQKSWGWFSSDPRIRDVLERKCNHPPEAHDVVEGKLTPMTASYPEALCTVFAKVLMSPLQIWSEWEDSCAYLTNYPCGNYCATCLATSHILDATQNDPQHKSKNMWMWLVGPVHRPTCIHMAERARRRTPEGEYRTLVRRTERGGGPP